VSGFSTGENTCQQRQMVNKGTRRWFILFLSAINMNGVSNESNEEGETENCSVLCGDEPQASLT